MLLPDMGNNTHNNHEAFIHNIAEVFALGLAVADAMRQVMHSGGRTARVTFDEQEWMLETIDIPQMVIKLTLIE